MLLITQNM